MQAINKSHVQAISLVALMIAAGAVMAGTGSTTFDSVWTTITDWMQGTLGRVLVGMMILTGIGAGVLRQSLMSFVVGVGGGVGLYAAPDIIESIMTATVPASVNAAEALLALPVTL
ncbi:TraA family conjugative transfer protein [Azotobacter salinestris]|uniref:TraA family conjugative transfer protein n=1 Tax=Azotobacter salinestris TaxID=69964 RepID=UPI0032DE8A8A